MKDVLNNCCDAAGQDDEKAANCAKNAAKGCLVLDGQCRLEIPLQKISTASGNAQAQFGGSPTPAPTPAPQQGTTPAP